MVFILILINLNLEIKNLIKSYHLNPQKISIVLYSINEKRFIYTYNEKKPLIPASNLKLLISGYLLENWNKNFLNYLRRYTSRVYYKKRILFELNSKSNNQLANLLFYLIGKYKKTSSEKIIKSFLKEKKIPIENLKIVDGSGYSKKNRLTSLTLINLLIYFYFSPYQKEFLKSLAVSGKKGTLKKRLLNYPKQIFAKTGYLKNVYSLSGYYFKNDKKYIFSIIINDKITPKNYWQFLNEFFTFL
ncbi:MAG: D-alanyl-D-alanine carboxypeptidase [candidate division WOR-3 bacterium]|nr:D-alanyl-D-alanine carboxypeptidase [candidate division WOR-3 bacterium]MCX7837407.1 D-alanyl-D-alanine carboxypeptidase [candidate division WOR-3 bacterium]MDW8113627.1 D-alanyl-D-alanine carboxypeptidase [candidate division WOR-3 bacterium]